jgi:hypothetical protein
MSEKVYTNCTNAGPISVYVKDGNVVRIRPLVADEGANVIYRCRTDRRLIYNKGPGNEA